MGIAAAEDERWMEQALACAAQAEAAGEVPVGAVLVCDGQPVAEGWNQPIRRHDASAHAEILVLRAAGAHFANYRLPAGCTLYVTLEPCPMCAAALLHARLSRLVFGAWDPRAGAVDSAYDLIARPRLNHRLDWRGGVLEARCAEQLRAFFQQRRGRSEP
ncbi:MAG TPA: tRNA adenosine(34) deaminase TadA [Nevskiaceae bacterium]|nr:tRNA adenosine(34) deaminase TadA [Nevskiaceae bacterium]